MECLLLIDRPESPIMTYHKHTIHRHQIHHGWNNAFPQPLTITPGESVRFETADASGDQLPPTAHGRAMRAEDHGAVDERRPDQASWDGLPTPRASALT